jgi:hypothetical protein
MKKLTITVKVPFKAGRLDAAGTRAFRNKKKYTRKTKHPKEQD